MGNATRTPGGAPWRAAAGWLAVLVGALAALLGQASRWARRRRRRRVPVVLQMSANECGAACLAMVLSYHGRPTRVEDCRRVLQPGRDGLTALALARAARSQGLRVRAFSVAPAGLAALPLPAIVHWEFDHFVVVEGWGADGVDVVDPASGRRRLAPAEFDAGFTGVVLCCEPGEEFVRGRERHRRPWLSYLRAYALAHPGIMAQVLGATLLLQVLGLAVPLATKALVDGVLPRGDRDLLTIFGIGLVALAAAQAVTAYLRSALLVYLQGRVEATLQPGFLGHLLALPYRFFEGRSTGDLAARLGSSAIVRETLTSQTVAALLDGLLAAGYLAWVLGQDALIGSVVVAVGLAQAALLAISGRKLHGLTQRELAADGAAQGHLVEALTGIATIKAAAAEERTLTAWTERHHRTLQAMLGRGHLTAVVEGTSAGLRAFAPLALLWLGAMRVLDGEMSLGTMLAVNALATAALLPLNSAIGSVQRLGMVAAHLDRLADVLDEEPEQAGAAAGLAPAPRLSGRIDLDGVGFRFGPDGSWVLRDVSLTIAPGQKVAVVGRTGAGKSTLAKLLLGLYQPNEGGIRFDGQPAAGLDRQSLRRQFGVVLQQPVLFDGSVRENVALGDPGLDLGRVIEAARLAAIHEEVVRLPMGYETPVGEGGSAFSGGQRQRIALARALARRPAVLLLDEATSHLDATTEAEIERNLAGLRCTRIVIAHRLSTVRDADTILVVEGGAIAERGTHAELLARGGIYAAMVRAQDGGAPMAAGWVEAMAAD